MGQHDRTRRFPPQTAAISTSIQRDIRSKKSHARPDQRRPQRIKNTSELNYHTPEHDRTRRLPPKTAAIPTLIQRDSRSKSHARSDQQRPQRTKTTIDLNYHNPEKVENGQIVFDMRFTLCPTDNGTKTTELFIRPIVRRYKKAHRRTRRNLRRADSNNTMPTETPPSLAAERRRATKQTKKTKGNDGAENIGASKARGMSRSPPSPELKNLDSNKRQQKTDPIPPIQRSVNKKGMKNITQSITAYFPGEKTNKIRMLH